MRFGRSMDHALERVERRETGRTFPADEVVWGIVVRPGFDELDDPAYHRGTTQHAYLEGNDLVALCGFRPPRSGPRGRRRTRLGLPATGVHPMCGTCARKVVAPRPRVPVPVAHPGRPAVVVPVGSMPPLAASVGAGRPVAMVGSSGRPAAPGGMSWPMPAPGPTMGPPGQPLTPARPMAMPTAPMGPAPAQPTPSTTPPGRGASLSSWLRRMTRPGATPSGRRGLLARGVHAEPEG